MNLNIISLPRQWPEKIFLLSTKIPGSFVFMGTSGTHEWHHPAFTVDERALPISAEYFALLAEKALKQFR